MTKWVYYFGETGKADKHLVGGKGANLSEMTKIGLPIPTGYTVSMECSVVFGKSGLPAGFLEEEAKNLARLEQVSGKKLGDLKNPLLVSVRSGSSVSMPGMMDTVLNLGLNDEVVEVLGKGGNMRFAYDSYRRFIMMFSDVVKNLHREKFDEPLWALKSKKGYKSDTDMTTEDLKGLCALFKKIYKQETGESFPTDPRYQLTEAIQAVFQSWNNPRAHAYREINNIDHDLGTAVNIQEMVYGNMGDDCATGVAFTRNPSTGENKRYGEYLPNAQGEDVVAGVRTPIDLNDMKINFPQCSKELYDIFTLLEDHYSDMQDIEFTIEKNKLYILQTRNGKRTAGAAVNMAVQMVNEGRISKEVALMRLDPEAIDTLLHKQLDATAAKKAISLGKGLPASPGAAVGQVYFTADAAIAAKEKGIKVILVRTETSPEDITGMTASQGILTSRGGMTSHAAVVARGMNLPCICGATDVVINEKAKTFKIGSKTYAEGAWMSLDGNNGNFYNGKLPVSDPAISDNFHKILEWCREIATCVVRTNCDTPKDAAIARSFGAQGIGLTRTEHMFFGADRILPMREMIIAGTTEAREKALAKLLPIQRADFHGILGAMDGLPVIIRLIDPPLHEFLPHEEKEQQDVANQVAGGDINVIKAKVASLHEFNPMLGFRGCRLGVVYPEINAMQVRAIFEAALALIKEGKNPWPQIEVPLVGHVKEFQKIKDVILAIAKETGAEGVVKYEIGTMIEVPRAALRADELATVADFMSFGTNDLTQMTCGFSRDDSGVFLKEYVKQKIYKRDPFAAVDQDGVGRLMQLCVSLAREVKPGMDIGICGEHGGEPSTVKFCHRIGLSNVSCSPYRVPVAQLAAAQARIEYGVPQVKSTSKIFQIPSKL